MCEQVERTDHDLWNICVQVGRDVQLAARV
jgi:hypothetical protein